MLKIIGILGLSLIIVTAIVVANLKPEVKTVLDKVGTNQLGWVFFEDSNANGEFDYNEKIFKSVSVAVRRPGETGAFITVPADDNGLIKIDGLQPGSYEVQYLNYEWEQPYEIGDFSLKRYYQSNDSFLPTEWQKIELTSAGFKTKVGLREYQPGSVLAIKAGNQVKFYDPVRAKILGQSQWTDETERQFYLKGGQVYYLQDKQLKQFSFKDKLVTEANEKKEEQSWFYSNESGSYFYDKQTKQTIKYTALGSGVNAVVSQDGKYVGAKLNNSIMVVDYPAVMASGVEKHYLLPFSGQIVFSDDEVLINQGKEIVRVELKGNGVWEIKDRIELKDIQADEVLGEIRLN